MLSFPYNSSSPILYYNKDIFDEGRARSEQAAEDLAGGVGRRPQDQGERRRAVRLHHRLADLDPPGELRGVEQPPVRHQRERPRRRTDIELTINSPIFVKHFQEIADLAKDGVFKYGGRTSEAKPIFLNGECGIYTNSSGGLGDVIKSGINYGTGPLPYDPTRRARRTPSPAAPACGSWPATPTPSTRASPRSSTFLSQHRRPGEAAPEVGLPAGDDRRLRRDQGVGLLRHRTRAASSRSCR